MVFCNSQRIELGFSSTGLVLWVGMIISLSAFVRNSNVIHQMNANAFIADHIINISNITIANPIRDSDGIRYHIIGQSRGNPVDCFVDKTISENILQVCLVDGNCDPDCDEYYGDGYWIAVIFLIFTSFISVAVVPALIMSIYIAVDHDKYEIIP